MKPAKRRSDCPISFALDVFGDRWTLLVIRDLMFKGKVSYGDFLRSDERIATNILADRLNALERAGIVKKRPDSANRKRLVYALTAKGVDLAPVLVEIILWSAKYDSRTAAPRAFVSRAKGDRERLVAEIRRALGR